MFESIVPEVMGKAFDAYWKATTHERVKRAQRLNAWLENDEADIVAQIRNSLFKMFRPSTVRRMSVRVFNVVPRVVSRLAKLYAEPPVRTLDGGLTFTVGEDGSRTPKQSPADVLYQDILKASTIDRRMKEAERRGLYFNTVLVQPVYVDRPEELGGPFLDYVIHTPAYTVVEWGDMNYLTPKAFYFPAYREIEGKPELVLVYWSATEHYYIRANRSRISVPESGVGFGNPYGMLPIAVLRIVETNDGWGNPMWDLADGNMECCEQVTNITYTAKWQAHGQAVAVNTGLKGEPEVGPDRVVMIEDRTGGTVQPSFSFASPNPKIAEVQGLVDWMLRTIQSVRGIAGASLSLDASVQSGVSKIQDTVELAESRKDMVTICTETEKDLFRVTRAVWNYHSSRKIDPSAEFDVKFKEPEPFKSVDDKVKERTFGLENNTMSHVEIILEDNPGMTEAEAVERFDQIVAEKRRLADKFGFDETPTDDNVGADDESGNKSPKPPQPPAKA